MKESLVVLSIVAGILAVMATVHARASIPCDGFLCDGGCCPLETGVCCEDGKTCHFTEEQCLSDNVGMQILADNYRVAGLIAKEAGASCAYAECSGLCCPLPELICCQSGNRCGYTETDCSP